MNTKNLNPRLVAVATIEACKGPKSRANADFVGLCGLLQMAQDHENGLLAGLNAYFSGPLHAKLTFAAIGVSPYDKFGA